MSGSRSGRLTGPRPSAMLAPMTAERIAPGSELTAVQDPPSPDEAAVQPAQPELPESEVTRAAPADARAWDAAELERATGALLFAANEPLSNARLANLLEAEPAAIEAALAALAARLAQSGLPFELREIAGGWQLFTAPDTNSVVEKLARVRRDEKVSPASLETLSVIAYRQPVTKAEIEAIRGVQVGPILRALVDRGLVRVAGRADVPGHPLLYGTTKHFLDVFGLGRLEDLPRDAELVRD